MKNLKKLLRKGDRTDFWLHECRAGRIPAALSLNRTEADILKEDAEVKKDSVKYWQRVNNAKANQCFGTTRI